MLSNRLDESIFAHRMPNMDSKLVDQARAALRRIAYPLARILLRYGVSFDEFAAIAKQAYVEVAARDFSLTMRPASKSRIALLTGLNRREVARVLESAGSDGADLARFNRSARIVSGWFRDADFPNAGLAVDGEHPSFVSLVKRYGGDIPAKAVLRELLASGAVREQGSGLGLVAEGYVPAASETDKLSLLGTDVGALLATIDNNLANPHKALFQRKVSFGRLSPAGVECLLAFAGTEGRQLIVELDQKLAPFDQPEGEKGQCAGLGMYVFVEDSQEGDRP